jgi:tRNA pseudouridine(55) synthase
MIIVWKEYGLTPLEKLEQVRSERAITEKMCYAGRLDPMAQGWLQLLVGDNECCLMNEYCLSSKTYQFEAVLGVSTDTYDSLGLTVAQQAITESDVTHSLTSLLSLDVIDQKMPIYSAYRVKGKPLWYWNQIGKIATIQIPSKRRSIHSIEFLGRSDVRLSDYCQQILPLIAKINGNFRQQAIIDNWKSLAEKNPEFRLVVLKLEATVSSGTYIRGLVNDYCGVPAHACSITRTEIAPLT